MKIFTILEVCDVEMCIICYNFMKLGTSCTVLQYAAKTRGIRCLRYLELRKSY
jgi:hypothetical protein